MNIKIILMYNFVANTNKFWKGKNINLIITIIKQKIFSSFWFGFKLTPTSLVCQRVFLRTK